MAQDVQGGVDTAYSNQDLEGAGLLCLDNRRCRCSDNLAVGLLRIHRSYGSIAVAGRPLEGVRFAKVFGRCLSTNRGGLLRARHCVASSVFRRDSIGTSGCEKLLSKDGKRKLEYGCATRYPLSVDDGRAQLKGRRNETLQGTDNDWMRGF